MIFLIQITHLTNCKIFGMSETSYCGKKKKWKGNVITPIFIDYEKSHQTKQNKTNKRKSLSLLSIIIQVKIFRIKKEPFIIINMKIRKKREKFVFCFWREKKSKIRRTIRMLFMMITSEWINLMTRQNNNEQLFFFFSFRWRKFSIIRDLSSKF